MSFDTVKTHGEHKQKQKTNTISTIENRNHEQHFFEIDPSTFLKLQNNTKKVIKTNLHF